MEKAEKMVDGRLEKDYYVVITTRRPTTSTGGLAAPAAECLPGGKEVPLVKAVPRYLQIINYYQGMIDAGKLSEGQQMPTEEAIGALFSVSRITVRQALDGLAQAGYIYKVQGKGSFVASKKAGMQLNHLIGFSDEMRSLGLEPSTILVEQSLMLPTEAVAKALNIDVTQKIYFLTRIRCADGVPMAVEKVHMPFYRFAGIETQDLSKSLYALLKEQYGCECSKAVQSIQAGAASSHDAKLLKIKTGMPVLCISRTTYGMDGAPFEYVDSIYRGDKYIFNVTLEK
jgi:GntR family transcriptional regulator